MRYFPTVIVFLLLSLVPHTAFSESNTDKIVHSSNNQTLQTWLHGFDGAERGILITLANDFLSDAFPEHNFFSFYFRQYPIARETPKPFSTTNILIQSPNDEIIHVTKDAELLKFFQEHIRSTQYVNSILMTKAWLSLSPQLLQDGFYEFSSPEIAPSQENSLTISGHVNLTNGGRGKVHAKLEFSPNNELLNAATSSDLQSGIRPICQATKLLDDDPIVRKMAEQDILVMGSNAKPYLDEQRLMANPSLKKEIDRVWLRIVNEGR